MRMQSLNNSFAERIAANLAAKAPAFAAAMFREGEESRDGFVDRAELWERRAETRLPAGALDLNANFPFDAAGDFVPCLKPPTSLTDCDLLQLSSNIEWTLCSTLV